RARPSCPTRSSRAGPSCAPASSTSTPARPTWPRWSTPSSGSDGRSTPDEPGRDPRSPGHRLARGGGRGYESVMSIGPLVPCLWLDDQAEAAARSYAAIFPGGRVLDATRYPAATDNPAGKPPGSVLTVEVELCGTRFTLLNGGSLFTINPSISFFVRVDGPAEADRIWGALVEGGEALMPLDAYPFSERYGWVQDRYRVSWQIVTGRRPPGGSTIAPCLMFAGPVHGKAEA